MEKCLKWSREYTKSLGKFELTNETALCRRNLPRLASWRDLQDLLTRTTATWQAEEAGYPKGYGLKHGKWLYQTFESSVPQKHTYDLVAVHQYHEMRSKMDKMGVSVLVWHVRLPTKLEYLNSTYMK